MRILKKTKNMMRKKGREYNLILLVFVLAVCTITAASYGQDPTKVYEEAVKSCAIVTDASENGIASGFFINNNIFITNRHVTKHLNKKTILIKKKNGEEFSVKKILKEYTKSDIAIIETEGSSSSFLKLARAEDVRTGEKVFAIGNPTSADFKVYDFNFTEGIINNITFEDISSESFRISSKVIVHSASLNPGNSGGPLINVNGDVIGINAFVKGGMANNYFFAIHLEELTQALDENSIPYIISSGDPSKGYITKNADSTRLKQDSSVMKGDSSLSKNDSAMIKSLSVTGSDDTYLIAGLIAFGALALILIPVMVSKSRRQQSRPQMPPAYVPQTAPEKKEEVIHKAYLIAEGKQFLLTDKTLVIGREPGCDVVIHDKNASRQHFQVICGNGEYVAVDLNSKNGTLINGSKITRKILYDSDKITAGSTIIVFIKA